MREKIQIIGIIFIILFVTGFLWGDIMKEEKYKGQTKRIWYSKGHKDGLTEAIELLESDKFKYVAGTKELQIYTVNPIILELKALRGDFN